LICGVKGKKDFWKYKIYSPFLPFLTPYRPKGLFLCLFFAPPLGGKGAKIRARAGSGVKKTKIYLTFVLQKAT